MIFFEIIVYFFRSDVLCKRRYQAASRKYTKQFLYELKMQEAMQPSAYDAMRFNR